MRISKKILSIVLAMLMLVSVCLVPSSASAPLDGTEDAAKINVKYEVTQPDSLWDEMLMATDNNLYAVTVYVKAAYGINVVQVPLYYDADLFSPFMWSTDAENPIDNGDVGYDGWYADNSEDLVYDFGKGEAWSDTTWYRSNGNAATSSGNARYIGLGRSEAKPLKYEVAYVESSNTDKYDAYTTVPDDNFDGYMYVQFINNTAKTAYCNAVNNAVVTDYISIATLYFIRNDGVSAEDCIGAQFGWAEGGDWLTQSNWDTSGKPSYYSGTYVTATPGINYVSNAVVAESGPSYVEEADTIVSDFKWQWRDNGDGTYAMRNLATIDGTALNQYLNNTDLLAKYGDIEAVAEAVMVDFGFIVVKGGTATKDDMAVWHQTGTSPAGITYAKVKATYLNTTFDAGNYVMSYLIEDVPAEEAAVQFNSLGYVVLDTDDDGTGDKYYYYDAVTTSTFNEVKA